MGGAGAISDGTWKVSSATWRVMKHIIAILLRDYHEAAGADALSKGEHLLWIFVAHLGSFVLFEDHIHII